MMGTMNASLYLDSAATYMDKSRTAPARKQKFVRFTNSIQAGKNISKVRWLVEDTFFSVPDPFATEYFVSGSWSWEVDEVKFLSGLIYVMLNLYCLFNSFTIHSVKQMPF